MRSLFVTLTMCLSISGLLLGCDSETRNKPGVGSETPGTTTPTDGEKTPGSFGNLEGSETQNGGYGVNLSPETTRGHRRIVSLDLYLRNAHKSPYLSTLQSNRLSAEQNKIIANNIGRVASPEVVNVVALKLSELKDRVESRKQVFSVDAIIENIESYTWLQVEGFNCLNVEDDRSPVANKVQLAYREGRWVRFCDGFKEMDAGNQAALLFHEIVYASLSKKSWVTQFVGYLFSSDYEKWNESSFGEFEDLILTIEAYARGDVVRILETAEVSLDPEQRKTLGVLDDQHLCFANALLPRRSDKNEREKQTGFVLQRGSTPCATGLVDRDSFATQAVKEGHLVIDALSIANSDGLVVTNLCFGEYTALCTGTTENNRFVLKKQVEDDTFFGALKAKNIERMAYLRDHGAVINAATLKAAIALGDTDIIRWVVACKVDVSEAVFSALYSQEVKLYSILLAADQLSVGTWYGVFSASSGDFQRRTDETSSFVQLIHLAARFNEGDAVTLLAKKGANLDSVKPGTTAPITYAIRFHNAAAVQALVENGAQYKGDVSKQELTNLERAVDSGELSIVKLLVDAGIDGPELDRALKHAIDSHVNPEIVSYLVAHGAKE